MAPKEEASQNEDEMDSTSPQLGAIGSESIVVTLMGPQTVRSLVSVLNVLGISPGVKLLDLSQMVVRDRFIATAELLSRGATDVVKDVLFRAHSAGLRASFRVGAQSSSFDSAEAYILTVFTLGAAPASLLAAVASTLRQHDARVRGARRMTAASDPFACYEFTVDVAADSLSALRAALFELGRGGAAADFALQRAGAGRRAKRMAVFDLSWTLVQCDAVDVVLQAAGRDPGTRPDGMSDADWTRQRVHALEGADADRVNEAARQQLRYTHGASELCAGLRRLGCRLAVVSSGSQWVANAAKEELRMDYAFGNVFDTDAEHCFTGEVRDPVVDADRKAELVQMLAMQERISVEQIIVVADGPVSAKMLEISGLPVAFDQPPSISPELRSGRIASKSLASVLYLLGCSGSDLRSVTSSGDS